MEQERRQTGAAAAAIAELNTWEAIKKSKLKQKDYGKIPYDITTPDPLKINGSILLAVVGCD